MWVDEEFIFNLYEFFETAITIQDLFFLEKENFPKKDKLKCKKRLSISREKRIYYRCRDRI